MVLLIEELVLFKNYRTETMYSAVTIADKYLVRKIVHGFEIPCLVTLAVTCILMAAKFEESIAPSFI